MNINTIFNLFSDDDPNDEISALVDFSEHPLFWVGGFNKLIKNHLFFKQYTIKVFKNIDPELEIGEIEKAGEYLMFDKAWGYISRINTENPLHIDCIKIKSSEEFINNLEISILFFEKLEEYEKCAHMKVIKDKIKEFLI